ncbi:MAG TPA: 50S ribosomal protein L15 [Patescibacteria group bacterium]|nr:50S ribosomal protein L15 [Patescibacteria group bacterium]
MSLTLSNLKPAKGSVKRRKKVGRGGKRGTYSGRGIKGQKSRSGGKSGLKAMGFKQTLQRIPKSRGFKSLKPKMEVINLSDLELKFNDGDKVTVNALIRADLISGSKAGVKVLAKGKLTKKLIVVANAFSESAKDAIISAGGKIEII